MCGACGTTTVPDPVLGPVRTKRMHLVVAGTVNELCSGRPGAPKVSALPDGWLVSGPSGAARLFHTVEELWGGVIGCFTDESPLQGLLKEQQTYAAEPENAGLPARTARTGIGLTELAISTPARTPRCHTPRIPPTREDSPQ
ncbi:hypothetical protein ABH924_001011 [Arthrobacter sp. GAS37]